LFFQNGKRYIIARKLKSFQILIHKTVCILAFYRGADKSLARPDWKKTIGSRFSSDAEVIVAAETWLDGQTFWVVFEWLAKFRVWSL